MYARNTSLRLTKPLCLRNLSTPNFGIFSNLSTIICLFVPKLKCGHASLEAKGLTHFLPSKVGLLQRPHQNLQFIQKKILGSLVLELARLTTKIYLLREEVKEKTVVVFPIRVNAAERLLFQNRKTTISFYLNFQFFYGLGRH
jgi:hypothetical protein